MDTTSRAGARPLALLRCATRSGTCGALEPTRLLALARHLQTTASRCRQWKSSRGGNLSPPSRRPSRRRRMRWPHSLATRSPSGTSGGACWRRRKRCYLLGRGCHGWWPSRVANARCHTGDATRNGPRISSCSSTRRHAQWISSRLMSSRSRCGWRMRAERRSARRHSRRAGRGASCFSSRATHPS